MRIRTSVKIREGLLAVLAAAFIATIGAATVQADTCNDTSWTWPFCHIGRPSIPHVNMGGPRPPLTPKNSVWCTASLITVGGGAGWYRVGVTKHAIRFWPDYYHLTYVGIVWNGRAWLQTRQAVYTSTDCDA